MGNSMARGAVGNVNGRIQAVDFKTASIVVSAEACPMHPVGCHEHRGAGKHAGACWLLARKLTR